EMPAASQERSAAAPLCGSCRFSSTSTRPDSRAASTSSIRSRRSSAINDESALHTSAGSRFSKFATTRYYKTMGRYLALLMVLGACGDDTTGTPGVDCSCDARPDARIDAAPDAPMPDAPDIDAPPDAPTDAAIDAPMIDAPPPD